MSNANRSSLPPAAAPYPQPLLVRGRRQLEQLATSLDPGDQVMVSIVPRARAAALPSRPVHAHAPHPTQWQHTDDGRLAVPRPVVPQPTRRRRGPDKKPRKRRAGKTWNFIENPTPRQLNSRERSARAAKARKEREEERQERERLVRERLERERESALREKGGNPAGPEEEAAAFPKDNDEAEEQEEERKAHDQSSEEAPAAPRRDEGLLATKRNTRGTHKKRKRAGDKEDRLPASNDANEVATPGPKEKQIREQFMKKKAPNVFGRLVSKPKEVAPKKTKNVSSVSSVVHAATGQAQNVWNSAVAFPPYSHVGPPSMPAGVPRPMLPIGFGAAPMVNPAAVQMTQLQISQAMLQQQAIKRKLQQLRGGSALPVPAPRVPIPAARVPPTATAATGTTPPPEAAKPKNIVPAAAAKVSVQQHKNPCNKGFIMSSPDVSEVSDSDDNDSGDDHDVEEEDDLRAIVIPPGRLGITVRFGGSETVVERVEDDCPFKDKINVDDRILTVDGRRVFSAKDFAFHKHTVRLMKIAPRPSPEVEEEEYLRSRVEDFLGGRGCTTRSQRRVALAAKLTREEATESPAKKSTSGMSVENKDPAEVARKKREKKETKMKKKLERRQEQREEFYEWHVSWEEYQSQQLAQYVGQASDDGWERRCRQLQDYKRENDGEINNVSPTYKAPDDMTFGEWVAQQRKLYHEGKLLLERAAYLREQGLDFHYKPPLVRRRYTGDKEWDAKFFELIEYRIAHGDCDVPITYPTGESLGQWVQKQRDAYFAGTLDKSRHEYLEEKGFLFEPGTNVQKTIIDPFWMKSYRELKQFKRDHGHIDIPLDYKATPLSAYLDRFISFEGTKCRKKQLSFHKIRMLKELGVDVATKKTPDHSKQWEKSFDELVAYKNANGNCLVPTTSGGPNNLGQWVRRQRKQLKKSKIIEDRLRRLLEVGFDFDPRNTEPIEEKNAKIAATLPPPKERDLSIFSSPDWYDSYESLKRFVETNGHSDVDPEYDDEQVGGCLYTWLETQKTFFEKNELPSDNAELLEELGVDLTERSNYEKSRPDVRWNDTYKYLKLFYERFGHGNVPHTFSAMDFEDIPAHLPFCECRDLGKWITRQRKMHRLGKLSEERRLKLEEVGVDLNLNRKRGKDAKPRKKRTDKQEAKQREIEETMQHLRTLPLENKFM